MDAIQLIGSTIGLGFVAGIRLYATILALGLAIRFHLLHLSAQTASLEILAHPAVLAAAGSACLAEFFVDKVPWMDSLWDSFHTFIRPVGAAILAAAALGHVDPVLRLTLIILCGGVAFASHSSKAATRLLVNHSPEPFTNIGLSLAGDALTPFGIWLSLRHPVVALSLVLLFLGIFAWVGGNVFRSVRLQIVALRARFTGKTATAASQSFVPAASSPAAKALDAIARNAAPLPERLARFVARSLKVETHPVGIRVGATNSIEGLRNSIGYLIVAGDDLAFVTRRRFRCRLHRIKLADVVTAEWKAGLFLNGLTLRTRAGDRAFYVFKDVDIHAGESWEARESEAGRQNVGAADALRSGS